MHAEHARDSRSLNPGNPGIFCSAGASSQIVHTSLTAGPKAVVRKRGPYRLSIFKQTRCQRLAMTQVLVRKLIGRAKVFSYRTERQCNLMNGNKLAALELSNKFIQE